MSKARFVLAQGNLENRGWPRVERRGVDEKGLRDEGGAGEVSTPLCKEGPGVKLGLTGVYGLVDDVAVDRVRIGPVGSIERGWPLLVAFGFFFFPFLFPLSAK